MKAILLAAGRGSRLKGLTDDRPKCLVELGGIRLLDWQLAALGAAGIEEVVVVTGYRADLLDGAGVRNDHNPDWAGTTMVHSLLCAAAEIDAPVVVSYTDIVYGPEPVRRLVSAPGDLALIYDTEWRRLWDARFDDPMDDAENLTLDDDGRVRRIGGRVVDSRPVDGQYMGLLRITPRSCNWIADALAAAAREGAVPDMTALLSRIVVSGHPVYGVPVAGNWCEIDRARDLAVGESMIAEGALVPPPWH